MRTRRALSISIPTTGIDKTITWCYDICVNLVSRTERACTTGALGSITASIGAAASNVAYQYKLDSAIQKGKINGRMLSGKEISGYQGLRFSSKTGMVYSLELHPNHNNHCVHIQWNQWFTTYPKFPGEYALKALWRISLW